jgi:hypothetical protein
MSATIIDFVAYRAKREATTTICERELDDLLRPSFDRSPIPPTQARESRFMGLSANEIYNLLMGDREKK